MDVYRFAKQPARANDPTRRYRIVRWADRVEVGDVEIVGGGAGPVVLTVDCSPELSDAAREDAVNTARRFLAELVTGWGLLVLTPPPDSPPEEQPDGRFRVRLEYEVG